MYTYSTKRPSILIFVISPDSKYSDIDTQRSFAGVSAPTPQESWGELSRKAETVLFHLPNNSSFSIRMNDELSSELL
jgi:hypothetical protein